MKNQPRVKPGPPLVDSHAICAPGRIELELCGRSWTLYRPAELEELWDAISDDAFAADERLPYWVELWPSSLALALWLVERQKQIKGRTCLDLGCGLGFTAIIASWLGARVIGMDYEPDALFYTLANAVGNAVPEPACLAMDWRTPAIAAGSLEYVWGGDVMYENRFVEPVLNFLDHSLAPGGTAWIAEPGRGVYDQFIRALLRRGWKSRRVADYRVVSLHVQVVPVPVKIWEIAR